MRLFIAEKPELGKSIAEALGNSVRKNGYIECGNDVVTWCVGHLLTLAIPDDYDPRYKLWKIEYLPMNLRPAKLVPKEQTAAQLKIVTNLIKQADSIVHAGDPDDQGQLIVDELLEYVNYKNRSQVKRILINDMSIEAIKKALNNLQDNTKYVGLSNKAQAQSIADQIYGTNMSRAYTITTGSKKPLRCGRVQTPILGLIVNAYLDNKNHVKQHYYTAKVSLLKENIILNNVSIELPKDAPINDNNQIVEENYFKILKEKVLNKTAIVNSIIREDKQILAPLPYSLLDLQVEMSKKYNISASKTLEITQGLRQKFHCITYNRSDCSYLTDDQYNEASNTIKSITKYNNLNTIVKNCDVTIKSRAFNNSKVSAHTGIIPTPNPTNLTQLNENEKKVYEAICIRYLIQFIENKVLDTIKITLNIDNYQLTYTINRVKTLGWSNVYKNDEDAAEEEDGSNFLEIFKIKQNDEFICNEFNIEKQETKPRAVYTEASLLKDLKRVSKYVTDEKIKKLLLDKDKGKTGESGGIGTPATRDKMLESLKNSGYYEEVNKKLIPTELGISFIQSLPKIMSTPDMTALWHEKQSEIEKGLLSIDDFLDEIDIFVKELINNIDTRGIKGLNLSEKGKIQSKVYIACLNCKKELTANLKGMFCSNCDFKIWRNIAGKELSDNQINTLVTRGQTQEIKGFKSKAGKSFNAKLIIEDKKTGNIKFVFEQRKKGSYL